MATHGCIPDLQQSYESAIFDITGLQATSPTKQEDDGEKQTTVTDEKVDETGDLLGNMNLNVRGAAEEDSTRQDQREE